MSQEKLQDAARAVIDAARFVPLCGSIEYVRLGDAINALAEALIDPTPRRRNRRALDLAVEIEVARGLAQLCESLPPTTPGDDDELPF